MLIDNQLSDKLVMYVFNERFELYDDMMAMAMSERSHRLADNYNHDVLSRSTFMTLLAFDDEPLYMFGTCKTHWPSVARGFYRFFKSPFVRTNSEELAQSQQLYFREHEDQALKFYLNNPDVLESFGINTVFTTRNYYNKRRDFTFGHRMYHEWGTGFKEHSGIRMYHNTPQRFYVLGDDSFLSDLPSVPV